MSVKFYNENAKKFSDSTLNVDMSLIYDVFLPYLPKGSHILDAGCVQEETLNFFLKKVLM
ncbi:MAG: hypothetical protein RBR53_08060 [Desulforegulaceae bacterium]|nr:hypothetical protein [Desulforegulaceae bacterium]